MKTIIHKIKEKRLIHYVIAGGAAFTIEYGSFLILYYHFHVAAVTANTVSFILGLITSFMLNRLWVFGHKKQHRRVAHQISLYLMIAGINLIITDVVIHFLVQAKIPAFIAKILLVILVACWNFVIFRKIIFTHRTLAKDQ
jgi:putative flippase GtrA